MSKFQLAIIGMFMFFGVLGVLFFMGVLPGIEGDKADFAGDVVVWGTIPLQIMRPVVEEFNTTYDDAFRLSYVAKSADTFETELVEALASGSGPDIFFLSQDLILRHKDKIIPIPYETITERVFKDTFIEEGELFFTKEGIVALPLVIDPLVLFWNRSILSGAGIARAPVYWDDVLGMTPLLTKKDQAGNITQSAISLGSFNNITHAKDILSALFLQVGVRISVRSEAGLSSDVAVQAGSQVTPTESALRFYTDFANASGKAYTWNISLPEAKAMFLAEKLALYPGYASELATIAGRNTHLNFDVARLPQLKDKSAITFGKMTGIAIAKGTKKAGAAYSLSVSLASGEFSKQLAEALRLPPARRDLLSVKSTDQYKSIFYESALQSRAWLDPHPKESYTIFEGMVDNVLTGRLRPRDALFNAQAELNSLLSRIK